MIGSLQYDKDNNLLSTLSEYQPSEQVKKLTLGVGDSFNTGYLLQNKPFREFNDLSLLDREDLDRKRWNAYREPASSDPDEYWRWNGIRPITRNKLIGIVAQMTARIVVPAPYAQNEKDEVDTFAAMAMRDLMEYDIRSSSYVDDYIMWITDALVSPAAYLGVGYVQAMQTVKYENEGKISTKEVLDGVLSGFQTFNIPIDEILIGNFYQKKIDKQPFIIRRRFIDYGEAESLYGTHENWKYIAPGLRLAFSPEADLFYESKDDELERVCEEVVYKCRLDDLEIPFCNGIYLGDKDTEANLIKHRDNEDRPGYNMAVLGYEDISSRFFFYKSAAWKLGDDDALVIRTEQLLADAVFLDTMPPTITSGQGQLSEAIVIPGKNTTFESADVRVEPIRLGGAISSAMNLLLKKERDMSESSLDPMSTGVQAQPKTAEEARLLANNARIVLGRFGNMLAGSLRKLGGLMIDVILQHQTVADVQETSDGDTVQKFKTFVLTDSGEEKLTKRISFNPEMPEMTEEDVMLKSEELLKNEGGIDSKTRLIEINPTKWRKLKYLISVDVEELLPLSLRQSSIDKLPETEEELQERQKVGNI